MASRWRSVGQAIAAAWLCVMLGCTSEEAETPASAPPLGCAAGDRPLDGGDCLAPGVPMGECGDGFESDGVGGCVATMPPAPCPPGQLALPGETACHEVSPCGRGTWGDIPVEAGTQYVDGSYAGGSNDGTAERPWVAIGDAVGAAQPGSLVAVAAGSYVETLHLIGKPLRIWGRCPALVEIVVPPAAQWALFIDEGAHGSELHGVALTGPGHGFLSSGSTGVVLDGIWIHDTGSRGIEIQDTLGPAQVTVRRALLEANTDTGIYLAGGELTVEDSMVRDVVLTATSGSGYAIDLQYNLDATMARAYATLRHSVVERATYSGVWVYGADALIERVLVRDTQPSPSKATAGTAIAVHGTALHRSNATIHQVVVERNHFAAISVVDSDATFDAVTIRDTAVRPTEPQLGGFGLAIQTAGDGSSRAAVTLRASLIERSVGVGIGLNGSDAIVESTIVRDTSSDPVNGRFGRGISSELGFITGAPSHLELRYALVERNRDVGVMLLGSDGTIEATAVRDTSPRPDGAFGDGVSVERASAQVFGAAIVRSGRAGLAAFGASIESGANTFECNTVHINGDASGGMSAAIIDLGGNACGCDGVAVECKSLSSNLTPPEPLE